MVEICVGDARERIAEIFGKDSGYLWDAAEQKFTDGELEFQLRSWGGHDSDQLDSILIRFCDDDTHTYCELWATQFERFDDWMLTAFSEELIERLVNKMDMKRRARK